MRPARATVLLLALPLLAAGSIRGPGAAGPPRTPVENVLGSLEAMWVQEGFEASDTSDVHFVAASGAGDASGDGLGDIVAVGWYGEDSWVAYVFPGTAQGPFVGYLGKAEWHGVDGLVAAGVGDVDGDHHDDVVVGSPGDLRLYRGADHAFGGLQQLGWGWCGVAGAGDVDGGGFDDVLLVSCGGGAVLYSGAPEGLRSLATARFDDAGTIVAGGGDLDGDGYDDLAWPRKDGGVRVVYGSPDSLDEDVVLPVPEAGVAFGASLDIVPDLDGDGRDDLVVGGPGTERGRVFVYGWPVAGGGPELRRVLVPAAPSASFGTAVAGVGDLDADGFGDLAVAAPDDEDGTGRVYVYHGGVGGPDRESPAILDGWSPGDAFGLAVDGAGDVDGEGRADLVVTAPGRGDGTIYVFEEPSDAVDADGDGWFEAGDCDDGDDAVNPAAEEVCNGLDDDCDGGIDLDAADAPTWWADIDGDGYSGARNETSCVAPEGYREKSAEPDCDDSDAGAYPGAEEIPDDGVDQDCDGLDLETAEPESWFVGGCSCGGPAGAPWLFGAALAALAARRR